KRTGQLLYGAVYGASIVVAMGLLDILGLATLFDKILFLPLLNGIMPLFDRLKDPPRAAALLSRRRVTLAIYAAVFLAVIVPYRVVPECLLCFTYRNAMATMPQP